MNIRRLIETFPKCLTSLYECLLGCTVCSVLSLLSLPDSSAREGVALEGEVAALEVEGEVLEVERTGGGHTEPHLVHYPSTEVDLQNIS